MQNEVEISHFLLYNDFRLEVCMKVIIENLKRCNVFYNSDFYQYLEKNDPEYIETVYFHICEDPDACDEVLYEELGKKFNLASRKKILWMELKFV